MDNKTQKIIEASVKLGDLYDRSPTSFGVVMMMVGALMSSPAQVEAVTEVPAKDPINDGKKNVPGEPIVVNEAPTEPEEIGPAGKRLTLEEQKKLPKRAQGGDATPFMNAIGEDGR